LKTAKSIMGHQRFGKGRALIVLALLILCALPVFAATNVAVVAGKDSETQGFQLSDLKQLLKPAASAGAEKQKMTLVMRDPSSEEMRIVVRQVFGVAPEEVKALIASLNEHRKDRPLVRIVESDEAVLKIVSAVPNSLGFVNLYAIDSSVKVLRVDGKLPFDPGYVLKGN
jgi:ABC-type phosphate transport system substrate-binding protein